MAVEFTVSERGGHTSEGVNSRDFEYIRRDLETWFQQCGIDGRLNAYMVRGTADGHRNQPRKAIRAEPYSVYLRVRGCFLWVVLPDDVGLSSEQLFKLLCIKNHQEPDEDVDEASMAQIERLSRNEMTSGRRQHAVVNLQRLIKFAEEKQNSFYGKYARWIMEIYYRVAMDSKQRFLCSDALRCIRGPAHPEDILNEMLEHRILLTNIRGAIDQEMFSVIHMWFSGAVIAWIKQVADDFSQYEEEQQQHRRQHRDQRAQRLQSDVGVAESELATATARQTRCREAVAVLKRQHQEKKEKIAELEQQLAQAHKEERQLRGKQIPDAEKALRNASSEVAACTSRVNALRRDLGRVSAPV